METGVTDQVGPRKLITATAVIGVGLSGFFDGILLHQVLQWHHLLSLVPGETFRDIGTQIFADGMFHVLMYAITALGLWLLWRRRAALSGSAGWRTVAGGGLLGFGIWNVIDVGFFHWFLGIHRIRLNVPDPMAYDVGWLVLFGLVPLALAWRLLRQDKGGPGGRGRGRAAAVTLSLLVLVAAPIAALPQKGANTALVLFAPGTSPAEAMNAVLGADGRIVWADPAGRVIAVALGERGTTLRLYARGAMLVTQSPVLAGCLAATRA